jgi:signal transduction histidine kinase
VPGIDTKEMDRVIDNIYENALQYNERGTEITLELKDLGESVQIIIKDNGIGIPKAYAESIFQPFVRTDHSRNSETGGSGLGLAIVYKIIKLHHGEIRLDSDTEKGCSFTISLPKRQ